MSSFWFIEVPDEQRFPALGGDLRVDAAVVGAGIAGVSAAYHLARAGKRVALLEANAVGTGDSGFTTAFATHFLDTPETTAAAYAASEAGIALFRDIIRSQTIVCDWEDVDAFAFARDEGPEALRRNYDAVRSVDPSIVWLEASEASSVSGFPAVAGFRRKNEGQFHIRKFLLGLAGRARAMGAAIHEGTEARDITPGASVTVRTPFGSVTADHLIVASGQPHPAFPLVGKMLTGAITFVIQASYPAAKPFPRALLWDYLHPYHYFRWVNETDLILGGEDRLIKSASAGDPHRALETWLRVISGDAPFSVVSKWQGTVFYTPDGLPLVGPHPAYGPNVIFAAGFGGNGMAHGLLAGQIAADLVQGRENPHAKIFALDRL